MKEIFADVREESMAEKEMYLILSRCEDRLNARVVEKSRLHAHMMEYELDPDIDENSRMRWLAALPERLDLKQWPSRTGIILKIEMVVTPQPVTVVTEWKVG